MQDAECIHGLTPDTCTLCKSPPPARRPARPTSRPVDGRRTPANSPDYFGHPWPEWFEMCDAAIDELLAVARSGRTLTYGQLWEAVERRLGRPIGNSWRQLPNLLGWLPARPANPPGLLLSALVVEEQTREPNEGFFRLAAEQRLLDEAQAPPVGEPWPGMSTAQRSFWLEHVADIRRALDAPGPSAAAPTVGG